MAMRDPSLAAAKADIRQQAIKGGEVPLASFGWYIDHVVSTAKSVGGKLDRAPFRAPVHHRVDLVGLLDRQAGRFGAAQKITQEQGCLPSFGASSDFAEKRSVRQYFAKQ
jgi:hypothetical protein